MTIGELAAYGAVPRIERELALIATLLRTIAVIGYASAIDCPDKRAVVLEKVREDLGIKTSAEQ